MFRPDDFNPYSHDDDGRHDDEYDDGRHLFVPILSFLRSGVASFVAFSHSSYIQSREEGGSLKQGFAPHETHTISNTHIPC